MPRLPLSPLGFGVVSGVVLLLDQVSKVLIVDARLPGPRTVVPGCFDLLYRENHGGAWGLFTGAPEWFRMPFFVTTSLLAVVFLIWLRRRMLLRRRWADLAFPAILGGAVGNLVDRVRLGYVVDFLDLHVSGVHWPTFNVADVGITVGVALLVVDSVFAPRRAAPGDGPPETKAPAPTAE